jgi:hypothetical protein
MQPRLILEKTLKVSPFHSLIEFIYEMILLFICIHFIHEFVENIQETNDVSSQSKSLNVADKYVVLETPQKDPQKKQSTLSLYVSLQCSYPHNCDAKK